MRKEGLENLTVTGQKEAVNNLFNKFMQMG